jgi:hypothetical protein
LVFFELFSLCSLQCNQIIIWISSILFARMSLYLLLSSGRFLQIHFPYIIVCLLLFILTILICLVLLCILKSTFLFDFIYFKISFNLIFLFLVLFHFIHNSPLASQIFFFAFLVFSLFEIWRFSFLWFYLFLSFAY